MVHQKEIITISSGNSSTWAGELDLDGLSNNRISSTIGNRNLEFKKFNTKPISHRCLLVQ